MDKKTVGSVLEEKSYFKTLRLTFYFKLDGDSYIISVAKTAFKKTGVFVLWSFFLQRLLAVSHKSTIQPFMEYCCHFWASAPSCYLELLDKLLQQICKTVNPSLAIFVEALAHCWNVASLSLIYRYYFSRCLSKLAQLVPLPYSRRSSRYSDRLRGFSATILRCYKDVFVNSFFPCTARLWNSQPIECFSLIRDLNGCKSRINL